MRTTKAIFGWTLAVLLGAGPAGASGGTDPCMPDGLPPVGGIVAPEPGSCFGAGVARLFVEDDFTDACDPELDRTYVPPPNPVTKIKTADPRAEQQFGHRVTTDESTILVASLRARFTSDLDVVHVFEKPADDWVETQRLRASDGARNDRFGQSLDVDGEWMVVGAPFADALGADSGAAYVFRRIGGAWFEHAKLLEPDGASRRYFGYDVAIDDGTIVVGSEEIFRSPTTGAAYVFTLDDDRWSFRQKLESDVGRDEFGRDVDVDGDWLMVSAAGDDRFGQGVGLLHAFRRGADGAWSRRSVFTTSPIQTNQWFGAIFSLDSHRVAVGVPGRNTGFGVRSGAVYLVQEQGGVWVQERRLIQPDGSEGDQFGGAVALAGDRLAVGAPGDDEPDFETGSLYRFLRQGQAWTLAEKFVPQDAKVLTDFGEALAAHGERLVAGVRKDDDVAFDSGAIYVLEPPPPGGYRDHGDHDVTLTVRDDAGNEASDSVFFVLDRIPPAVTVLAGPGRQIEIPSSSPFGDWFASDDDDGATGEVVLEQVFLDGCPVFDGAVYGNGDGRLIDEVLEFDRPLLCAALERCGVDELVEPELSVEATDCGGNLTRAAVVTELSPSIRATDCF